MTRREEIEKLQEDLDRAERAYQLQLEDYKRLYQRLRESREYADELLQRAEAAEKQVIELKADLYDIITGKI